MNKEILEALKEALTSLEKMDSLFDNEEIEKKKQKIMDALEEAIKRPCKIHIDAKKDGKCRVMSEGNRLSLLVTLAGAEKNILNELNCDDKFFQFIKSMVGQEDLKDE